LIALSGFKVLLSHQSPNFNRRHIDLFTAIRQNKVYTKSDTMPHKHEKHKTIRLTIDFPLEQHTYIKMLAAKEGISLRQFVIEHLPGLDERKSKKKNKNASDNEFDNLLKELLVEKAPMLRRLSKK
jgi:hypothetical protein